MYISNKWKEKHHYHRIDSHRKLCLSHQRTQGHVDNWEALEDATLLHQVEEKSPLQKSSFWFLLGLLARYSKPKESM